MPQKARKVQAKLMRGLLDVVILELLKSSPMHGYQVITSLRRQFGVYFGPSTIYPILSQLEEKEFVESAWDLEHDRPRKVYKLTTEGQNSLDFTEDSLRLICRQIGVGNEFEVSLETIERNPANRTIENKSNLLPALAT